MWLYQAFYIYYMNTKDENICFILSMNGHEGSVSFLLAGLAYYSWIA